MQVANRVVRQSHSNEHGSLRQQPSSKAGEYFEAAGLQWLPLVEERPRGSWRDSLTEFKP
jgi:hypothetical protein